MRGSAARNENTFLSRMSENESSGAIRTENTGHVHNTFLQHIDNTDSISIEYTATLLGTNKQTSQYISYYTGAIFLNCELRREFRMISDLGSVCAPQQFGCPGMIGGGRHEGAE